MLLQIERHLTLVDPAQERAEDEPHEGQGQRAPVVVTLDIGSPRRADGIATGTIGQQLEDGVGERAVIVGRQDIPADLGIECRAGRR